MLTALDLYLAHASRGALVTYTALAALVIGFGPFAVADLVQHVAAVRRGGR